MKKRLYCWAVAILVLLLCLQKNGFAQILSNCVPGWNGQIIIDGESLNNWSVEHDELSSGNLESVSGFIGNAVQLNWNIGTGDWVQAKYTFPQAVDLSLKDIFGISMRGSIGTSNRVSIMFADTNGVFFGMDCDGINSISRWMKNLPMPKKMFHHFFTIPPDPNQTEINWFQIDRFFVVVKRPSPTMGGGNGQLTIDNLQADRAADWVRQEHFEEAVSDSAAAANAFLYIMDQQKEHGLFLSWKEEPEPKAYLYDQALALIALTGEGLWDNGIPDNRPAQKAKILVDVINSFQKPDGHWPRAWAWNIDSLWIHLDDQWVGDQAWWVVALLKYSNKSGDQDAFTSAQLGASWLAEKIDSTGRVCPSTEGTVDVWWAMIASQRFEEADRIQSHLLTRVWDSDLKYWWAGEGDPSVALDCATWVGEFAKTVRVNRPEMARAALSFVRRTLVTTDDSGSLCGLDGMGPVSIWCDGTAQFVSTGGEDAQEFLDMLLSLQRSDGGMPGSTNNWSGSCFGWLSTWTGLAPTAWFYFALTRSPFDTTIDTTNTVSEHRSEIPSRYILNQNYPNPFNPSTEVACQIPEDSYVVLKIYNVVGQEIVTLIADNLEAGSYITTWNGRDSDAAEVSAGIYFCTMKAGEFIQSRKMVLLK